MYAMLLKKFQLGLGLETFCAVHWNLLDLSELFWHRRGRMLGRGIAAAGFSWGWLHRDGEVLKRPKKAEVGREVTFLGKKNRPQ